MMDIIVNINDAYTWQCYVMLTSLFENNKSTRFHVYALHSDMTDEYMAYIRQVCEKYGNKVSFITVSEELTKTIRSGTGYDNTAFLRLFADSLMPADVKKALYLDSDMIILEDLTPLWNTDLTDYAIGAVEDGWSATLEFYERLGFTPETPYVNSGVILMNLDRLRQLSFTQMVLDFMNNHWDQVRTADQDIFNALLHSYMLPLPLRYNTMDGFLRRRIKVRQQSTKEMREAVRKPAIIHYTGRKPWQYHCFNPYRHVWHHYQDMTPWAGQRPVMPTLYKWRKRLDYVLEFLHLRTIKYLPIDNELTRMR